MSDVIDPVLNEQEANLAKIAQRCIVSALDHSRAQRIALVDETGSLSDAPILELPPQVLRFFADVLGAMAERQPINLIHQKHELTTQEAAAFLNVSRPFVIKELEAGRLPYRKVGRHRRIEYRDLMAYRDAMYRKMDDALQDLADDAQENNMGY
jgi:excisionase family DNA binding protein